MEADPRPQLLSIATLSWLRWIRCSAVGELALAVEMAQPAVYRRTRRRAYSPRVENRGRLLVDCPDRPGIVAAVSTFLAAHDANIVEADQHATGPGDERLFMRMTFDLAGLAERLGALREDFGAAVAQRFAMRWRIVAAAQRPRIAVLASREPHCLFEVLWRWQRGELDGDITMVISNHPDHRALVEAAGVDYHHVAAPSGGRAASEAQILELVRGRCQLGVLARYMQILSPAFLAAVGMPLINIHHSFLPAFVGAAPYRQAYDRGVKIVGATAHYVTDELDAGPIIEQDVVRIDHRASVADIERLGADLERQVLLRAVRWHLDDRVLAHGAKTVVFHGH